MEKSRLFNGIHFVEPWRLLATMELYAAVLEKTTRNGIFLPKLF